MNKLIIVLTTLLIISTGVLFLLWNQRGVSEQVDNSKPTLTRNNNSTIPEEDKADSDSVQNTTNGAYSIKSLLIRDTDNILLFSNLEERLASSEALVQNNCTDLVTAGFYTKEFQHIGLFTSQYNMISRSSSTLSQSGYFYIDSNIKPHITTSEPTDARLAVQTYPILYLDGNPQNIVNNSDDKARRIVVATTSDDEVIFMVIYQTNSVFSGPTLAELPDIISKYNNAENLGIMNAINLDGGTHSAYISRYTKLPEISTIGGYFCMRY